MAESEGSLICFVGQNRSGIADNRRIKIKTKYTYRNRKGFEENTYFHR